ncbi:coronin-7 isoform X3 [Culicoides brevitarsis]|uniref:coronin-7 isoform X3 n=1 Tax=Culicoides brevitarsis TaxID=469753 RepID=UPI00307CC676
MAWRFKASKYKNAAPIVPKPEQCIRDIVVGSYTTYGNNIAASAAFMAFNWDHAGSSLAVLPLDDCGRKSKTMPLLHGHADTVTDLEFSPFHDGLLATGSQDCLVKIWHIPEKGLETSLTNPECTFTHKQRRVERVGFHPTADCLLYSTSAGVINLWDLTEQKEIFSHNQHPEVIQAVSWKADGTLLTTTCKDKMIRVIDPRAQESIVHTADSHQSIKDSRIVWLGHQNRILTTGFDAARLRQVIIRDLRNFNVPEKTLELDCSTGILMPLYDPDTNMLFLAGKGDTTIGYMEVTDKDPHLIEGIRHSGEQTKGACLVPKRALRVMEGEVNRVLQLTSNSVIPIMYQVPRKTYRDFHADLYPDTVGYKSELIPSQWMNGINMAVPKMCLDPAKRDLGDQPIVPRLGPKPFSSGNSTEFSFDKVFSVPQVPGGEVGEMKELEKPDLIPVERPTYFDEPSPKNEENILGKDSTTPEEESEETVEMRHKTDDEIFKRPTTAERRKPTHDEANEMFEKNDSGDSSIDSTDDKGTFDRQTNQRSSIAERRRMYEKKSQSVMEDKPVSPALKRRDSLKSRGEIKEEEPKRLSNVPEFLRKASDLTRDDISKRTTTNGTKKHEPLATPSKRTSTVFGRVSKFRHLKGTPGHKSTHIENIRNISRQIPGECDGFHANFERVAVPLSGAGGKIAIFELNKPGKLPDGVIPSLVNGSSIMDFQWDPFNSRRLAVACDDGMVKLWTIPEGGLAEPTNEPFQEFVAHSDKIYSIKYHPVAKNVCLTASYDMTVKIWDLETLTSNITLKGHTDQIFSSAWSPCGVYLATVCKDSRVRIFDPRKTDLPISEGPGPVGTRGARLTWALEGEYLVVTGFDKVSERQISLYHTKDLSAPVTTTGLDVAPAILIPYYDEDSSTLFVTGKGDSTIYAFEITDEVPYICPLSHHRCTGLHQGLSFLPKNQCDVTIVEFAKAFRLTNNAVEPLSFTVPRIKSELFQDDLFPPTRVTWLPTLSSSDWFMGKDKRVPRISLQPEGMDSLSSQQPNLGQNNKAQKDPSSNGCHPSVNRLWDKDSIKNKQQDIKNSVSARMEVNYRLEQDNMEGVDSQEWEE